MNLLSENVKKRKKKKKKKKETKAAIWHITAHFVVEGPIRQAVPVSPVVDRLVGLVVKASASRAEGPRFESRLRRDFFGVESFQ